MYRTLKIRLCLISTKIKLDLTVKGTMITIKNQFFILKDWLYNL